MRTIRMSTHPFKRLVVKVIACKNVLQKSGTTRVRTAGMRNLNYMFPLIRIKIDFLANHSVPRIADSCVACS